MIEYILNYLESKGQVIASAAEEAAIETGISLYLEENGIDLEEKREYENYRRRCLAEADHSQEKKCLEYLTVPEAAELAGVEPATIAYWYTTGKISVRKTGKIIRIPREAFGQWLLKWKEKGML